MDSLNKKTIVGVFDDYRSAERAALELGNFGIARDAIQVQSNFMTGAAGRSGEAEHTHEGGVSGFFHRLFGGEDSEYSGHYSEAVRRGNAVVTVTALPDQVDRAVEIMNAAGAVDIDRHVENYRNTGYKRHDPEAPPYSYDEAVAERERFRGKDQRESVPVVEEELQVGKRLVQRGGVRVHSHVVERPVEENIELREEKVTVDRRRVDRPVEAGDQFRDRSIEVTETAEEPIVQKRARVKEEVVVGKKTTTRTENVRDTVRRTEVEVDRLNAGDAVVNAGDAGPDYEYGSRWASDPRYQGRSWSDVEEDMRTDYMRNNPNSSWDRVKGSVRAGWEKATGKR